MKPSGGNYIQWSVAQVVSGVVCASLTLFSNMPFPFVLLASLSVIALYKLLYRWEHRATEGEMQSMLRVFSLSSLATLVFLTVAGRWLNGIWINALWSTALISRGLFGLIQFRRQGDDPAANTGKEATE